MNLHLVERNVIAFTLLGCLFKRLEEGDCLLNELSVGCRELVINESLVIQYKGSISNT